MCLVGEDFEHIFACHNKLNLDHMTVLFSLQKWFAGNRLTGCLSLSNFSIYGECNKHVQFYSKVIINTLSFGVWIVLYIKFIFFKDHLYCILLVLYLVQFLNCFTCWSFFLAGNWFYQANCFAGNFHRR